jgi:hypothetical protein
MRIVDDNQNPSQRLSCFLQHIALNADRAISQFQCDLLKAVNSVDQKRQWHEGDLDLNDPEIFATYADAAVSLRSDPIDWPLRKAFNAAKLDPKNPLSWRILLNAFCWSHFPPERKSGTGTFWTNDRYCKLLVEIYSLKPNRSGSRWENQACTKLAQRRLSEFVRNGEPLSGEALRRALQQARDPQYNWSLSRMVNDGIDMLREDYKRRGQIWPPVEAGAALARLRDLDAIMPVSSAEFACETVGVQGKVDSKSLDEKWQEEDEEALLSAAIEGNVDSYLQTRHERRQRAEKLVRAALAQHYCEQIASGWMGKTS